jgi:hypothetical protein
MNHAGAGLLNGTYFLAQAGEIGGEYGGNDLEHEISLPLSSKSFRRETA